MKRYTSYFLFVSCLMIFTPLYAATQTLTTYYPAPQGNYLNMTVNDLLKIPASVAGCVPTGSTTVEIANLGGVLEVCDSTNTYSLTTTTLWTKGATSYIYPNNSGESVAIGSATDPGYASGVRLGVTGAATISGNTTIGVVATPATLTVHGAETVSTTLGVTGNTTLSGTLGVTGLATLSTGLTVNGANAALNDGLTVTGGITTISDGLTITTGGNLTVQNGTNITLCTTDLNCGPFQVGYSGGKYYAEYGP